MKNGIRCFICLLSMILIVFCSSCVCPANSEGNNKNGADQGNHPQSMSSDSGSNGIVIRLSRIEQELGFENSNKTVLERIDLLEKELGVSADANSVLERIAAIEESFYQADGDNNAPDTGNTYKNIVIDDRFDLSNYDYRTVSTGGKGTLVFQTAPNGAFMNDFQYATGENIYVNLYWRQNGYAIAYRNGTYGYVDASYILWSNGTDARYDLSDYSYRYVSTRGRGNLVFQTYPNGSFLYDHQYREGERIYVNEYWRQDGYAIAYDNGTYGYVDASYIDWSSSSNSDDRYNLSYYSYRTVKTKGGDDTLVFQSSPNGPFMFDYQFWNGDSIYVNLNWLLDGYAIAYKNGTYGYVDSKYINW